MITTRQINSITKTIEKFNADYAAYTAETGETELPNVDCTLIGTEPAEPYTYKVLKTRVKVTDCDGFEYTITDETELQVVKDSLNYDRRRLNKAWRIWRSDNPDRELERDDDEE